MDILILDGYKFKWGIDLILKSFRGNLAMIVKNNTLDLIWREPNSNVLHKATIDSIINNIKNDEEYSLVFDIFELLNEINHIKKNQSIRLSKCHDISCLKIEIINEGG